MADQNRIQKVYQLKSIGYATVAKELDAINKLFVEIKKNKADISGKIKIGTDAAEIARLTKALNEQLTAEKALDVERKKKENELRALKILAQQEANTNKELANQLKELQIEERQLSLEKKKAADARREERAQNQALAGSYNDVARQYRELLNLAKNSVNLGNPEETRQATEELRRYKNQLDAFQRGLTKDGTLVGEYTTGIVQAFRQMGLDDLLKRQVDGAKAQLNTLDREFEELKQQLRSVGDTSNASLAVLENQLIDNRQEAQRLREQITLMGSGMGNQFAAGLRNGLKEVKRDIANFFVSYLSFQAALSTLREVGSQVVALDSQAAALQNVSKSAEELAVNEEFLGDITDRLGLVFLDTTASFKNFYAASTEAGISADETRSIFEAAASASANLKLSQQDTNGVLLAFGQIASKGKVQAEELRGQIGERIPGAFSIAARAIGVTQAELNGMLERGEVVASEFLPKFAAELQRTFGGDATERVEGLQASINRLKNGVTALVQDNQAGLSTFISLLLRAGSIGLAVFSLILGNLPLLISLTSAWALGWGLMNRELVIANARLLLVNVQLLAGRVAVGAHAAITAVLAARTALVTSLQAAYTVSLGLFTGVISRATAATLLFGNALRITPLGIVLTLVALLAAGFVALGAAVSGSSEKLRQHAIRQQAAADLTKAVNDATVDQISKLQEHAKVVTNNNLALDDRKKALADLIALSPEFLKGLTLQNITTREGIGIIRAYTSALREKATAEAVSAGRSKALQNQLENQQKAFRALQDPKFAKEEYRRLNPNAPFFSSVADAARFGASNTEGKAVADFYKKQAKDEQAAIEFYDDVNAQLILKSGKKRLDAEEEARRQAQAATVAGTRTRLEELIKTSKAEYDALNASDKKGQQANLALRKKYQEELDALNGKEEEAKTPRAYGGARLTGEQKDVNKGIDADRDDRITTELTRVAEIRRLRQLTEDEEAQHLLNLHNININAIDEKLAAIRGGNAEEKRLRASLNKDRIEEENKVNAELFKIRAEGLDEQRQQLAREAENKLNEVVDAPAANDLQKAAARSNYLETLLNLQIAYNKAMDALEKQLGQQSEKNEQARSAVLAEVRRNADKARGDVTSAVVNNEIKEIEDRYAEAMRLLQAQLLADAQKIFGDDWLNPRQKRREFDELERKYRGDALNEAVKMYDGEQKAYDDMLERKEISQIDYNKRTADLDEKRLRGMLDRNNTELEARQKKEQIEQALLAGVSRIGQEIINGQIEQQQRLLDKEQERAEKSLDKEKEARLAQAQSAEERVAIEAEFENRREALAREHFEKDKELKRQQIIMETALAMAMALASAKFPLNLVNAGIIAALAAVQLQTLENAQYAKGGSLDDTLNKGGFFDGPSHSNGGIPFIFRGRGREVEGEEGYVVNKKSMTSGRRMTATGTPAQIASAANVMGGGIDFAPGAKWQRFEYGGTLGANLSAPVFVSPPSYSMGGADYGDEIAAMLEGNRRLEAAIMATNNRVSNLIIATPVADVTAVQDRMKRAKAIGVL